MICGYSMDTYFRFPSSQIPLAIRSLKSLRELIFDRNGILEIDSAAFTGLTNLQHLSVNENQLNSIPHELGSLTTMRTFRAQKNQLTQLPYVLTLWPHLKVANCKGNPLSAPFDTWHSKEIPGTWVYIDLMNVEDTLYSINKKSIYTPSTTTLPPTTSRSWREMGDKL